MNLIDITKNNWEKVIFLTTREDGGISIDEEFVASNVYSILESFFNKEWIVKAIENSGELVGFVMYGFSEENNFYEISRFMIDRKYQGKGYGTEALDLIIKEMKIQFDCKEIYVSVVPTNKIAEHIYEKAGFVYTGKILDDEKLYVLKLNK